MSENPNPMHGHEVDGISELDNLLPRWWVWLFALTSIFAALYLLYYHVLDRGLLQAAMHEQEMAQAQGALATAAAAAPEATAAPAAEEPSTDPAVLARGKEVFTVNCVVCHLADGGGLIGPNLCDDSWIHGPKFADNLHIIREGVPAKGMITWKTILKPEDILAVGSYIYTLRGTTPAAPKAPEGVKAGT